METPEGANSYEVLRKAGIENSSNEWILRIDADERSHTKLNNWIKELVGSRGIDIVILIHIDTWRVVEAQDRRVLREQHLVTCQDSHTVGSRELD
jgi:glycosyltransferase involved in cell wall biosynthesis